MIAGVLLDDLCTPGTVVKDARNNLWLVYRNSYAVCPGACTPLVLMPAKREAGTLLIDSKRHVYIPRSDGSGLDRKK